MQKMRRLINFFLCVALVAISVYSDSLRVLTWNMRNFPSGVCDLRKPSVEGANLAKAAAVIRGANPDVFIVQEIRDSGSCIALIDSIHNPAYKLLICSAFCDDFDVPYFQQVAVFSRLPCVYSRWKRWSSFGVVDPPRGFAVAVVRYLDKNIAVFDVHLKSNMTDYQDYERSVQLNILKRELAIEELIRYISTDSTIKSLKNPPVIIAGDFNTNIDNPIFVSERSLYLLDSAGYENCFAHTPLQQRITIPGKGSYQDATFDYIHIKSLNFLAKPVIIENDLSDHYALLAVLTL